MLWPVGSLGKPNAYGIVTSSTSRLLAASRASATIESLHRLKKELGEDVFSFSRFGLLGGFEGGIPKVVQQMTSALNRQVQKEATQ